MDSLSDTERRDVLGEVLHGELQAILELVKDVPYIKTKVDTLEKDVHELKADMKIVKAAITDTNHQVQDHERRITKLEAAPNI